MSPLATYYHDAPGDTGHPLDLLLFLELLQIELAHTR